MTVSPPLTVLAILGLALAGTAWLAPEPSQLRPAVDLSAGAYNEVVNEARRRSTVEGSQMTVSGIIEENFSPVRASNEAFGATRFCRPELHQIQRNKRIMKTDMIKSSALLGVPWHWQSSGLAGAVG